MASDIEMTTPTPTATLTPAMKDALLQLPDCGGQDRWRLKGVRLRTLLSLEKRGLAILERKDPTHGSFDKWSRTEKGHPSQWMTD